MELEGAVGGGENPAIHVLDSAADRAAQPHRNPTCGEPRLDGVLGGGAVLGIVDAAFLDGDGTEQALGEKDEVRQHLAHEAPFLAPAEPGCRALPGAGPTREGDLDVEALGGADLARFE